MAERDSVTEGQSQGFALVIVEVAGAEDAIQDGPSNSHGNGPSVEVGTPPLPAERAASNAGAAR
jgi:hypothetical protein